MYLARSRRDIDWCQKWDLSIVIDSCILLTIVSVCMYHSEEKIFVVTHRESRFKWKSRSCETIDRRVKCD